MEDTNNNETINKKRARVDSESGSGSSPDKRESKRVELNTVSETFEPRVDSVSDTTDSLDDSVRSESGGIRNEILDILDDTDTVPEIQDLDSVIRSFEEEILQSKPAPFTDESQPDLGYLLEASDDELGLPPATSPTDNLTKNEFPPNFDSFELENGIPSYDPFGFGFGEHYEVTNEFLTVGGLFEYPEASDFSEFLWRPESESLPAV